MFMINCKSGMVVALWISVYGLLSYVYAYQKQMNGIMCNAHNTIDIFFAKSIIKVGRRYYEECECNSSC